MLARTRRRKTHNRLLIAASKVPLVLGSALKFLRIDRGGGMTCNFRTFETKKRKPTAKKKEKKRETCENILRKERIYGFIRSCRTFSVPMRPLRSPASSR